MAGPNDAAALRSLRPFERALLLVSILLPAGLLGLSAWQNHGATLRAAEARLERTSRILQEHAVKVFETHRLVIEQVNGRLRFIDWGSAADRADLHAMLKRLQDELDQVATITVVDAEGRLRASGRTHPADPALSFADRDWFQALRARATSRPFVSRSYRGRQSGQSVFNVAGRVTGSREGSFEGAIAVSVDRDYFESFYRGTASGAGQVVVLLREDGTILAQDPAADQEALPSESPFSAWLGAHDPRQLVNQSSAVDGVERTYAYQQVGSYPVYVGFGLSREAALAPWRDKLGADAIVALLAASALLCVSGLAIRQSRRERAAAAGLELARAELAMTNRTLEAAVAERTAELRDSNEEMQRYAYIVSHDLRAPLVNIMGFTKELAGMKPELLAAGPDQAAERDRLSRDFDEAVSFIEAATRKMEGLIQAILKLSRDGRRTFSPEPLAMSDLVRGLADSQRHQADAAAAVVEVGPLPDLVADRVGIEQVFGNLIDNAVKYLDPARPGRVHVTGFARGDKAVYRVEDNGRGIAATDHGHVFELFRRSGPRDRPGEGMGLAHVRTIVRAMGGRIDMTSELGRGTAFTLTFPRPVKATVATNKLAA